jgi:2,3-bisphosphoglycerate-independent phosphoglycerate mutase
MGNSEVGHMNLGAGRVVHQDFTRINQAITDGSFFSNPTLMSTYRDAALSGKAIHIMGLLSPGGVHSHEQHIKASVKMAFDEGVKEVWVHAFLDGRDVPPKSALNSLNETEAFIRDHVPQDGQGGITSIVGRYYAMDRDNRWERVKKAFHLINQGQSEFRAESPAEALEAAYSRGETDEFVLPTAITHHGKPVAISEGDAIIFMNFRADRAREITRAFTDPDFSGFDSSSRPQLGAFVTLTRYASDIVTPCVFESDKLKNSLGEYVSNMGLNQLRIAETEKYAHVTFFFSGGRETPFTNEDRVLIPSPKVATYDLQPAMSAPELTDNLVIAIESKKYQLIICNYANGDMVGHTGNLGAAIEAVECLDHCIARIVAALESVRGHCLITADHGNVEKMTDHSTGQAHTAHTSGKVPLVYIGDKNIRLTEAGGTLSDIAPSLLTLMNLPQPPEMTGESLIIPDE